jgi:hypothetical protein
MGNYLNNLQGKIWFSDVFDIQKNIANLLGLLVSPNQGSVKVPDFLKLFQGFWNILPRRQQNILL